MSEVPLLNGTKEVYKEKMSEALTPLLNRTTEVDKETMSGALTEPTGEDVESISHEFRTLSIGAKKDVPSLIKEAYKKLLRLPGKKIKKKKKR